MRLEFIANEVREWRKDIELSERGKKGGETGGIGRPKNSLSVKSTEKLEKKDTRVAVAKEFKIPERKIRQAQEKKG